MKKIEQTVENDNYIKDRCDAKNPVSKTTVLHNKNSAYGCAVDKWFCSLAL